jgi:hypothetical protein
MPGPGSGVRRLKNSEVARKVRERGGGPFVRRGSEAKKAKAAGKRAALLAKGARLLTAADQPVPEVTGPEAAGTLVTVEGRRTT